MGILGNALGSISGRQFLSIQQRGCNGRPTGSWTRARTTHHLRKYRKCTRLYVQLWIRKDGKDGMDRKISPREERKSRQSGAIHGRSRSMDGILRLSAATGKRHHDCTRTHKSQPPHLYLQHNYRKSTEICAACIWAELHLLNKTLLSRRQMINKRNKAKANYKRRTESLIEYKERKSNQRNDRKSYLKNFTTLKLNNKRR